MNNHGRRLFTMSALAIVTLVVLVSSLYLSSSTAFAAWSGQHSGIAAAAASVMPTGTAPSGTSVSSSVTISWSAAKLPDGTAVAGYAIRRYDATTGTVATIGPGCSGVVTATTCAEQSVPAGTWTYTDTPLQANWTGGQSPDSTPVAVN